MYSHITAMTKRPQEQPKPQETTHRMHVTMPFWAALTPERAGWGWGNPMVQLGAVGKPVL